MIKFTANRPGKNKKYQKRVGAYAIIINKQKKLAVIKTKKGYFLPGGGKEKNESFIKCLIRECLEETGYQLVIIKKLGQGNCYMYSARLKKNLENIGHFYHCAIKKFLDKKTEPDHTLVWLSLDKAIKLLYLANQREVIKIFQKIR